MPCPVACSRARCAWCLTPSPPARCSRPEVSWISARAPRAAGRSPSSTSRMTCRATRSRSAPRRRSRSIRSTGITCRCCARSCCACAAGRTTCSSRGIEFVQLGLGGRPEVTRTPQGRPRMKDSTQSRSGPAWLSLLPPARWLAEYRAAWLASDVVAGVMLAAYAIPVSLAYAGLAGLPPQVGIYGYLLGGLGYALLGSSRQLAIGPTSAISLMIAGTVGGMAGGDAVHYAQIASLAGFTVALLCLIAWCLRLSVLVRLISDSILVGFKAGAGLTIIMTQFPSLLGVSGGGHNFFERAVLLLGELGQIQYLVLAIGLLAIAMLLAGERAFPGRPVALAVVILAIAVASVFGLPALGVPITGKIPQGLPSLALPTLRLRDVDGIFPLAAGCLLLAYIEGVSAARSFATKYGYELDPRQEFLGLGAANLAAALGHGYPVAGGLSQSAVNDKAGARTPLALIFASLTLAVSLLFLTGFLQNLPKAVLAAVVFTAVLGLVDIRTLSRMWRISKADFYAATIALAAVLLLGILQGILLAAAASVLILLARA